MIGPHKLGVEVAPGLATSFGGSQAINSQNNAHFLRLQELQRETEEVFGEGLQEGQ